MALGSFGGAGSAACQEAAAGAAEPARRIPLDRSQGQVVPYTSEFFSTYRPNTAFDMVQQLPGFQIDDGASLRGYGGAAGNVLIGGRRPGGKEDAASAILRRIPASHVERIELVRGHVRGIELQGHSVVANVILRDRTPPTVRWEALPRYNLDFGFTPEGSVSISDTWKGVQYNAGLTSRRYRTGELGKVEVLDPYGNPTERRIDKIEGSGHYTGASVDAATWSGNTFVQLNANVSRGTLSHKFQTSRRIPQAPGVAPHVEYFHELPKATQFEIGGAAERFLRPQLHGKAIFLFAREDSEPSSLHRIVDAGGDQTLFRRADTDSITTEAIARLEFDVTAWHGHFVQFDLENARNVLDNALVQFVDTGAGFVPVIVPGANSRIEERRWEFLLKDTRSLRHFDLDYGLGAEVSTISQSGDASLERSFVFLKPEVLMTFSPVRERLTRVRLAREVAQLDFRDFVSATMFQEDDLALGNPELRPETSWIAEVSHERRFGDLGVVTLTAFHHWITDVEDLLPLTSDFEVPGNIGDGRRWGFELDGTVPLDWLALASARLDVQARWQDSVVEDPVTGEDRVLSGPNGAQGAIPFSDDDVGYAVSIAYRQDFETARVAWGWVTVMRDGWPVFKVNELVTYDEGIDATAFVETSRWLGLTMRLDVENVLDFVRTRDRTVFIGERAFSPVAYREGQARTRGIRFVLTVSGTF